MYSAVLLERSVSFANHLTPSPTDSLSAGSSCFGSGGRGQARRGGRGSRGQGQHQEETPNSARRAQVDARADGRLRSPVRRVNNSDAAAVAKAGEAKAAAVSAAATLREGQRAKREGGKRVAGSDAAAGAGGAATASTALTAGATEARRGPAKRAKVVPDAKVLWSPGKTTKDGTSLVGGGGVDGSVDANSDGSNNSHSVQKGRKLRSLAASFRKRYGEDLTMDEREVDGKGEEATLHSTGGSAMSLADTMLSMSPTKMASEVQKARARAREQRFSIASKSPGAMPARAPFSANAGAASRPSDSAANERASNGGNAGKSAAAGTPCAAYIPTTTAPAPATTASAGLSAEPAMVEALASGLHVAGDVLSVAGWSVPPSSSNSSVSSPSPATMIPVVPPAVAENKVASLSGPRASGPAVVELFTLEDEDSPTTGPTATKRPISDGGDVAVVQPPPKKMMPTKPRQGTSPGKVHTLRLRLRTDAPDTMPDRTFDGGVEESKGFEPPNPQPPTDGGVEECKGFDPPNLPPTRRRTPDASPVLPSPGGLPLDVAARPADLQKPPTASAMGSASAAPVASPAVSSLSLPDVVRGSGISRQSSWGPSFGISDQAENVSAVSTPEPVAPSSNPWVLSPSAPTFAKNRGRPLAQSFSQPAAIKAAVGSSGSTGARLITLRPISAINGGGSGGGRYATTSNNGNRDDTSNQDEATTPSRASGTSRLGMPSSVVGDQATNGLGGGQQGAGLPSGDASHPLSAGQSSTPLDSQQRDAAIDSAGGGGVGGVGDSAGVGQDEEAAFTAEAGSEENSLGVRVGGRALELLERLKREREESLDFDRKLTQALLDL